MPPPPCPRMPGDDRRSHDRSTPSRLGGLEYSHPVFELFRAPRSGDFSAARFLRLSRHDPAGRPGPGAVRRRDAGAARAKSRGGRVLLWTSTLDLEWNDMPVKAVFLPFVHTADEISGGLRRSACIIDGRAGRSRRRAGSAASGASRRAAARSPWRPRARACRSIPRTARSSSTSRVSTTCARRAPAPIRRRCSRQRRSRRIGSDADGSAGTHGGGGRARVGRAGELGEARPATTRRRRRSGSGGICWSPGDCCWRAKRCSPIVFRAGTATCLTVTHESRIAMTQDTSSGRTSSPSSTSVRQRWRMKIALRGGALARGVHRRRAVLSALALQWMRFTPESILALPDRDRGSSRRGRVYALLVRPLCAAASPTSRSRSISKSTSRRSRRPSSAPSKPNGPGSAAQSPALVA